MIRPLNRNLIVKEQEWEDRTESGLILTTNTTETPSWGVVIKKAVNCKNEFNEGDIVYYPKYVGSKLSLESGEFLVIFEKELFGVKD